MLKELKVAEEREITRILKNTTSLLNTYRLTINEAIEILSLLDLLQAKARLAKHLNCSTPKGNQAWLCETGKITIKGAIMQHIHKNIKINSGIGTFVLFAIARAIIANSDGTNIPSSSSKSKLS